MKKSRFLLGLLPAVLLSMFVMPSAMADGNLVGENQTLVATDQNNPVRAAITKELQMPVGTNMPDAVFHFGIDPVSVDGVNFDNNMPSIPAVDIKTIDPGRGPMTLLQSTDDTLTYYAESGDIFANVEFPHAGVYKYTVIEEKDTNSLIDDNTGHEALTYTPVSYELTIYVANKDGGGTYIYELGTERQYIENDQGVSIKVDPTPGGGEGYPYSQMIFTNTYVKTNGADDTTKPDPLKDATLTVSNELDGILASYDDMFTFTIKVTPPSLVTEPPAFYKAYIVDSSGVINPALNAGDTTPGTDDLGQVYLEISTKDPNTFQLKGGQSLVFVDTPVGTSYVVTDQGLASYEPSLTVTTNGIEATPPIVPPAGHEDGATLASGTQWVGEGENSAIFTNLRNLVTETGLSMGSLPFVGVMALAVVALAGFAWFTVRSKRRVAA